MALHSQMDYIQHWALANGYTIVGKTAEVNSKIHLDGFSNVERAIREHRMDVLIVKDLESLLQVFEDISQCIEMLQVNGVDLISITDGFEFDLPAIRIVA